MNSAPRTTRRLGHCLCLSGLLSLTLAAVNGCTSVAGSSPVSRVRVIDASSNAPAFDVDVSGTPIAANVVAPSFSNYAYTGPGAASIRLYAHGTTTTLAQISGVLAPSGQSSVYVTNLGTTFQASFLTDQSAAAPPGFVSFRFLQQANVTGAVDIYLIPDGDEIADAKPLISALPRGSVTQYMNVAAGTYDLVVAAAGTTKGAYTSTATVFSEGQVMTALIVDQQLLNTPPVNVLIANDVN
jgi:hypothetical protein